MISLNLYNSTSAVGPDTEKNIYTDDFFAQQDIVVNALDNLTARLYVDG